MIFDNFARKRTPEPRTRAGEVLLSHNHICLLHALYDRPAATAVSTADWMRAALPYTRLFRYRPSIGCLEGSIHSLHNSWVTHKRPDHKHRWTLAPRGLAILERTVPARIRGVGPYEGLRGLRDRTAKPRVHDARSALPTHGYPTTWDRVEKWWAGVVLTPTFRETAERIGTVLHHWWEMNMAISQGDKLQNMLPRMKVLRRYVLHYVMTRGELPVGEHLIVGPWLVPPFEVDFDELT